MFLYHLRAPSFRLPGSPATGLRRWGGRAKGWDTRNSGETKYAVSDLEWESGDPGQPAFRPCAEMHALLHAAAPDCPLRKFGILRGNGHEARVAPLAFKHHGLPGPKRTILASPDPRCVTRRFLWHVQRIEERLRFHRCSGEIVGDYRNPLQCRVRLVARPSAKELDGKIHHETARWFAPSIPRQRET